MHRFYLAPESIKGNTATLNRKEAHHIMDVLRLKKGSCLELIDGKGGLYQGRIYAIHGKKVEVNIERAVPQPEGVSVEITLIQALPKKQKMDGIVEKATELGVDVIIPLQSAHTVVKLDKEKQTARKMRWQRIAMEAAKQCACPRIPRIETVTTFKDIFSKVAGSDLKLFFCLNEKAQRLKDILRSQELISRNQQPAERQKVAVFIGPEGDFSPEEIHQAQNQGCQLVSLGQQVLKSDTASASALAILNYELKQ